MSTATDSHNFHAAREAWKVLAEEEASLAAMSVRDYQQYRNGFLRGYALALATIDQHWERVQNAERN